MNLLDVIILVVLLLGFYFGLLRGLLRPLIAEVGAIAMLAVIAANPGALDNFVPHAIPRPLAVLLLLVFGGFVFGFIARVVVGAAYHIPLVRPLDRIAGFFFNGLLTFALVYLALSALIALDGALQPIRGLSELGHQQVLALQQSLARNPGAALFVDRNALQQMERDSSNGPIPVSSLGAYDGYLQFYEQDVRPELVGSSLGPIVVKLGERLPLVGHRQAYPAR